MVAGQSRKFCNSVSQRPIDRCSTDLERLRDGRRADTAGLHFLDLCGINARFATLVDAPRPRTSDPFRLALPAQVGLELREHAQHVEEARPCRLLVSIGCSTVFSDAFRLHSADYVLQVPNAPRQPVDPRNHQHIALAQNIECDAEFIAARRRYLQESMLRGRLFSSPW
jgi:hypothetical protein